MRVNRSFFCSFIYSFPTLQDCVFPVVLRDVHSQHVYLQEGSLPSLLSAVEQSEWPQFIS